MTLYDTDAAEVLYHYTKETHVNTRKHTSLRDVWLELPTKQFHDPA